MDISETVVSQCSATDLKYDQFIPFWHALNITHSPSRNRALSHPLFCTTGRIQSSVYLSLRLLFQPPTPEKNISESQSNEQNMALQTVVFINSVNNITSAVSVKNA